MNETTLIDLDTPEGMEAAVAWQSNFVFVLREGGVWAVPRSLSVITVYHSTKTAVFTMGSMIGNSGIVRVFKEMGWTCKDGSSN